MSESGVRFIQLRGAIPHFEMPPYYHSRYEELIPDTLDIAAQPAPAIEDQDRGSHGGDRP